MPRGVPRSRSTTVPAPAPAHPRDHDLSATGQQQQEDDIDGNKDGRRTAIVLLLAALFPRAASAFAPYGYHSGRVAGGNAGTAAVATGAAQATASALPNVNTRHGLVYFAGVTYNTFFDSVMDVGGSVRGAMGMSAANGGLDAWRPHMPCRDCFLGALRLPVRGETPRAAGTGGAQSLSTCCGSASPATPRRAPRAS